MMLKNLFINVLGRMARTAHRALRALRLHTRRRGRVSINDFTDQKMQIAYIKGIYSQLLVFGQTHKNIKHKIFKTIYIYLLSKNYEEQTLN